MFASCRDRVCHTNQGRSRHGSRRICKGSTHFGWHAQASFSGTRGLVSVASSRLVGVLLRIFEGSRCMAQVGHVSGDQARVPASRRLVRGKGLDATTDPTLATTSCLARDPGAGCPSATRIPCIQRCLPFVGVDCAPLTARPPPRHREARRRVCAQAKGNAGSGIRSSVADGRFGQCLDCIARILKSTLQLVGTLSVLRLDRDSSRGG